MKPKINHLKAQLCCCILLLKFAPVHVHAQAPTDEPVTLDAFISQEVALEDEATLMPGDVRTSSLFPGNLSLLEIPRSVSVLTPEMMDQFDIQSFADLNKIGAGTQQYYDFGLPGSPYLRGWKAGTFFNGMLRAYQVNELPMSFGSLERMELIKGMAPAHFIPSNIAGAVNFVPKSPFFDESRGAVEFAVTSFALVTAQFDYGGPVLLGDTPAAYRVSISGQTGDEWYDDVKNDYLSVYASLKAQLSKRVKLFTGGEYFVYDANEAPGWNRATQQLIDEGQYIIGEPASLMSPTYGGRIDRDTLDFINAIVNFGVPPVALGDSPMSAANLKGFGSRAEVFAALMLPPSAVSEAVASGTMTAAQRDLLINVGDPAVRAELYDGIPAEVMQSTEGFIYSPDYVAAGGPILTAPIGAKSILSDTQDTAEATNFLYFLDLEYTASPDVKITNKSYFEYLETDKASYYGYAFFSEQFVYNNKSIVEQSFDLGFDNLFSYGVEFRYTEAEQKQDYWIEPFARRDLTRPEISNNTRMPVGDEVSPNSGVQYWVNAFDDPDFQGGNSSSDLFQAGAFFTAQLEWNPMFITFLNARAEYVDWKTGLPGGLNVSYTAGDSDTDTVYNVAINQLIRLNDSISLFAVYQDGTTFIPSGGGVVLGADSFADAEMLEFGIKGSFNEGKLFMSLSAYEWEQGGFNVLSGDVEAYEAEGVEFEVAWQPTERLTLLASLTAQEVRNVSGEVPFGSRSYALLDIAGGSDTAGLALRGGLFEAYPLGSLPASNPDGRVPGSPEVTAKLFALFNIGNGFEVSGGAVYSDAYWGNYERTLRYPSSIVLSAGVTYRSPTWEVRLNVENLTNEDYYFGGDPIVAGSILVTKAPSTTGKITVKYKF